MLVSEGKGLGARQVGYQGRLGEHLGAREDGRGTSEGRGRIAGTIVSLCGCLPHILFRRMYMLSDFRLAQPPNPILPFLPPLWGSASTAGPFVALSPPCAHPLHLSFTILSSYRLLL
jgi:hypothetical protein